MLARLCVTLTLLLFGSELSPSIDGAQSYEVVAGYRTGVRSDVEGRGDLALAVATFLKTSPSARALAVAAYGSGGEIEFFSDLERTGFRLRVPAWARPMVEHSIAAFFSETPQKSPDLADRALAELALLDAPPDIRSDVRSTIESRFRAALFGARANAGQRFTRDDLNRFFAEHHGTDRAFVLIDGVPVKPLESEITTRKSLLPPGTETSITIATQPVAPIRVQSDMDEGAVFIGAPVASVYYRSWYAFLMLDRLIPQTVSARPSTTLLPALDSYYYRMDAKVPSGQTAESVEKSIRQDLEQLEYVRVTSTQLEAARRSAIQYLESESTQRWFLSLGIPERRLEGLEWVRTFSADDMRAAARDLVESNLVIAGWSPKVKTIGLQVERLSDIEARSIIPAAKALPVLAAVEVAPFPSHTDALFLEQAPVRLESGVSVVASSQYAVFVAPDQLKVFDGLPGADAMQSTYGVYRADRILVMVPEAALDRAKRQWTGFKGNVRDRLETPIGGKITSADIPALYVLKMMLDRRLIEAGLWSDVHLEIRAIEGSTLNIHSSGNGSDANQQIVRRWISEIASRLPSDNDVSWAREAAIHRMPTARPDLQSLVWQWNPDGVLFDIRAISAQQIQEVAGIYLQ